MSPEPRAANAAHAAPVLRQVWEARRNGCCFDGGSYQPHIHTLSAPMHGHGRELVGVITLLRFPQDFDPAVRPALVRELKFTAGGCTQLISGHASGPGN
mgnify:CR=1 FL=1